MRRHELSDEEWAIIQPLLPNKPRGVPRVDDRRVLNGILWRFRTGAPWRDVPERRSETARGCRSAPSVHRPAARRAACSAAAAE